MTQLVHRASSVPPQTTASSAAAAVRALPFPLTVPAVPEVSPERWARWVSEGLEHDRVVRQRFQIVAGIIGVLAVAAWLLWTTAG